MARKNLLKGFKKPKGITFEHLENNSNYGKFTAYPFEPGFGTTVGNTLRRVLLSSIQGYAISSVRITSYDAEGVPHVISSEFETIPNISEDTLEVLNSLKQIRLRLPRDVEQETIFCEFTGPGTVKSDDLEKEGQLEVMTKGLEIFTMMEGAHLELEFQVDLGRGYVPAEVNEHYIEIVGTIAMDCIFTPVPKVKYSIEPCRVGQRNDYDKLILEIWTDGSITPEDALAEAAKIAKDYFAIFVNFNESEYSSDEGLDEGDERIRQLLNTSVEELELSVRSSNCLKNANIKTIGELCKKTEDDITKTRNFGKKSLEEIKAKLEEHGLTLGMTDFSHLKDVDLGKHKDENE
ncbi:MAG: DNA-directed RNA polymerase subunit alpha [Treponema sp.]|uniref:DNA-directed RNA polymerase subunit alpha n=1 Tax=Treponema sp. TaxID=166 RepID=UPI00298D8BE9|nr:DNA-directed RNA polymerase subunit alpha [Treponema sp.]MCI7441372.1 DNA-directed RNA polymerase subunit alpha [Spirochaetia bacterium]MDD7580211.1 DNA-directed RNA polymerase subunit alpha [Treponema sp.]MDY3758034.1 DNA-directed RNA polymerase subunit alpha [Treponema sp.]MDY4131169.1 DNA-directed RNA polymerase subunit alpha [Treponema sp.]MDY5837617.1 DNA-directed RNA polymerase subunit alpha [Treponema sp.]